MADKDDYVFGIDRELRAKQKAKFDPVKQGQAQAWLEALTGAPFPSDFHESLKSGVILCQALNAIKPGSVPKINTSNMAFKQRENITYYLEGCKALGMKEIDVFVTQDLYEGDNLPRVVDQIHSLGSLSQKVPSFKGPYIGVKQADKNERHFSEEVLNAGASTMSKISQGSYGYQDESKNPSLAHQIVRDHNVTGVESLDSSGTKLSQGSYGYQDESNKGASLRSQIVKTNVKASEVAGKLSQGSYGVQDDSNKGASLRGQIVKTTAKASEAPGKLSQGSYGVQPVGGAVTSDRIVKLPQDLKSGPAPQ